MPIVKNIYYCNLNSILDDIMYSEANCHQPILSDHDDATVRLLSTGSEVLTEMYTTHCSVCPFRLNCSIFEYIHCDEDSDSFNTQVEICHNHSKQLYEKVWNDYVNDFD